LKSFFYLLCVILLVRLVILSEDNGQEKVSIPTFVEKEKYTSVVTVVKSEKNKPKEYSFKFEPKEKGFYDLEFWQSNYREKDSLTLKKTVRVEELPYDRTFKFTGEVYRVEIKYTEVGKIESTHIKLR